MFYIAYSFPHTKMISLKYFHPQTINSTLRDFGEEITMIYIDDKT